MKPQHDIAAHWEGNPKKVEFYRKDKDLRIKINVDRTTTVDRIATDADKRMYEKYLPKIGRPKKAE